MPSTWAVTKPCHCSYGKTLFAILGKGKGFQIKIKFHLFFRNKFNGGGEGSREAKINSTLHQVKLLRVSQNERLGSEALESLRNIPLKTTPTEQSSFSMTERHVKKQARSHCLAWLACFLFLRIYLLSWMVGPCCIFNVSHLMFSRVAPPTPILPSLQEQSGHEPPAHWYHNYLGWGWGRKRNSIIISIHAFPDHPCLPKQERK